MNKEIDRYISQFPAATQKRLKRIRDIFLEEVKDGNEAIKYNMPTILWQGNLIHYAAYASHIGIYPLPNVLMKMKNDIREYKTGKGSIRIPNDQALPEKLIRKLIRTRLQEKMEESNKKLKRN